LAIVGTQAIPIKKNAIAHNTKSNPLKGFGDMERYLSAATKL